jgi:hypothetical protein
MYAKKNLLNNLLRAIPSGLSRDEWLAVLPRALVAAFVKTDKDFQAVGKSGQFLSSLRHSIFKQYFDKTGKRCNLS